MLCNEGRRQAEQSRKERDRTRRKLINIESIDDLLHPLFDTFQSEHVILPNHQQSKDLLTCRTSNENLHVSHRNSSSNVTELIEIQSNLTDEDLNRTNRNSIEIYLKICEEKRVRPLKNVIDGLSTTNFNLIDMSINDLDLQVICLSARITGQGCVYVDETFQDSYTLDELDISRNPIRTEGLQILSNLFVTDQMPMIRKLNISFCQLNDADGIFLKKILQAGEMLEELYLSGNQFGSLTCKNLGSVLKDATNLKILDLSWNRIRGEDLRPLINSLKNHLTLERLDLRMNSLMNQGAILLANILPINQSLIEIDLSNNRIEHDGAAIFASKLEQNFQLKKLSFANNNIGTLGSLLLLKAIDHVRSQVEYLNIENILINDDFLDLYNQINAYLRPLQIIHGGIRGRLGREHPTLSTFTMMDDLDLKSLDKKSLHALFQRDPLKILERIVREGSYDFISALQKWDLEEHGHLTNTIYVIDFPSAVKDAGIVLDKTMHFILWNHLKKIEKKGSVSYVQFITRRSSHSTNE